MYESSLLTHCTLCRTQSMHEFTSKCTYKNYAPVKLFCPYPPPGQPRGHHFFCCCPGVLITLIFTCPALYNHQNHPYFECPALFYHTHMFSDPGAARGGMGAEQFNRRVTRFYVCIFFILIKEDVRNESLYIQQDLLGTIQ